MNLNYYRYKNSWNIWQWKNKHVFQLDSAMQFKPDEINKIKDYLITEVCKENE